MLWKGVSLAPEPDPLLRDECEPPLREEPEPEPITTSGLTTDITVDVRQSLNIMCKNCLQEEARHQVH